MLHVIQRHLRPAFLAAIIFSGAFAVGIRFFHYTGPSVFYQETILSRYSESGQAVGRSRLVRRDSPWFPVKTVFSFPHEIEFPGGTSYDSEQQTLEVRYASERKGSDQSQWTWNKNVYDTNGKLLVSGRSEPYQPIERQLMASYPSPSGAYTVISELYCLEDMVDDRPCSQAFRVKIVPRKGDLRVLPASVFGINDGRGLQATILTYTPDERRIILKIGSQQELSEETFFSVDLESGATKKLFTNATEGQLGGYYALSMLGPVPDRPEVYAVRYDGRSTIVRWNLNDFSMTPIGDAVLGFDVQLSANGRDVLVKHGYNEGFSIMSLSTGRWRRVASSGEVVGWTEDFRYIAIERYAQSAAGAYGLDVVETATDRRWTMYRQKVVAQSPRIAVNTDSAQQAAVPGDRLYYFVAIR